MRLLLIIALIPLLSACDSAKYFGALVLGTNIGIAQGVVTAPYEVGKEIKNKINGPNCDEYVHDFVIINDKMYNKNDVLCGRVDPSMPPLENQPETQVQPQTQTNNIYLEHEANNRVQ